MLTERERHALAAWVKQPIRPSERQTLRQAIAVEASSFVAAYALAYGAAPSLQAVEAALASAAL